MSALHVNHPKVIALARAENITELQALRRYYTEAFLQRNPALLLATRRYD